MNELNLFQYEGQQVRTVLVDGEPWFVLNDLCSVLEIANPRDVVSRIDPLTVGKTDISSGGQMRSTNIVNESGMYEVVIRANGELAKNFRRWITSEVLPQIRKTGSYSAPKSLEQMTLEVVAGLNARVEEQSAQLALATPKAEAFDAFLSASGDYDVRDAAQLLQRDHGITTGQRRLFAWMREHGWLGLKNRPYQHRLDQDLLRIKAGTHIFTRTNGERQLSAPQVRITPKGLERLRQEVKATMEAEDAA